MTNEEKILFVYNRIYSIDNQIIAMDYENKNEEDAAIFMDLVLQKKALFGELVNLGENVD